MTLFMPNHWSLLNDTDRLLNRAVRGGGAGAGAAWTPAVDILEESDFLVIIADVAGVAPENIEVSTEKGVLTIRGERSGPETTESTRFGRRERRSGAFERSFRLSDGVDMERISARCEHGVLEIRLPKRQAVQPRSIPVTH